MQTTSTYNYSAEFLAREKRKSLLVFCLFRSGVTETNYFTTKILVTDFQKFSYKDTLSISEFTAQMFTTLNNTRSHAFARKRLDNLNQQIHPIPQEQFR